MSVEEVPHMLPAPVARTTYNLPEHKVKAKVKNNLATINTRELRALDLIAAGADYQQVANVLGMKTRAGAYQLVKRALEKRAGEVAETTLPAARAIYMDRLEKLFQRWMPLALGSPAKNVPPDPVAAKLVIDMMARYAKVTGIEAPTKVEQDVTVSVGNADAQRDRVMESLLLFAERSGRVIDGSARETPAA